jgi:hypothetical protein
MEDLDKAFQKLREKRPDFPMPHFDKLNSLMPAWKEIRNDFGA